MKRLLFFCFAVFLFLPLQAQSVLNKACNMLRIGDKLIKQQVEYKNPGREGSNVLWDFSKQESVNNRYELFYIFCNDSLMIGREHRTLYKYQLRGDTLFSFGYENPTTSLAYKRPELLLTFPFHYKDKVEDYFYGTGDYCEHLFFTVQGKVSLHADAYGMMLLPSGDTLHHVLRIHQTKKIIERMVPYTSIQPSDTVFFADRIDKHLTTDTLWVQMDTYRWYAEGYRYPIFETVESSTFINQQVSNRLGTAFYYTPDDQYYELDSDPENQEKRDEEQERLQLQRLGMYPAGNKDENGQRTVLRPEDNLMDYNVSFGDDKNGLILEYCLSAEAEVSIILFDMQGRQMSRSFKVNQPAGFYQEIISLYGLQPGEYTLRITVNDQIFGEKIIK